MVDPAPWGTEERAPFPHQDRFLREFLRPDSPREHILITPSGLGARWTLSRLCKAVAGSLRGSVLILTQAALVHQMGHNLRDLGNVVPVRRLDRESFREFRHSFLTGSLVNGVTIGSIDFAKRSDVRAALAQHAWSLVILDAGALRRERRALGQALRASPTVSRFLMVTDRRGEDVSWLDKPALTVWTHLERDWDGRPLFSPRMLVVKHYLRSEVEQTVVARVLAAIAELSPSPEWLMSQWLAVASSSLAALEQRLLAERERLIGGAPDPTWEDEDENPEFLAYPWRDSKAATNALDAVLDAIDSLPGDTKMQLLLAVLSERQGGAVEPIIITTSYVATLHYLFAALQDAHYKPLAIHGGMNLSERDCAAHSFCERGGILLMTRAVSASLAGSRAHVLINYDLPPSIDAMEAQWPLIHRMGDRTPAEMLVLVDESGASPLEQSVMAMLRHALNQKAEMGYVPKP